MIGREGFSGANQIRNAYMIANGRAVFCSQPIRRSETVPKGGAGTPRVKLIIINLKMHLIIISTNHGGSVPGSGWGIFLEILALEHGCEVV